MTKARTTFGGYYAVFVGIGLATALSVAAIGYYPTERHAGGGGAAAMLVGCGVSWIASCIGALPTAAALSSRPKQAATAVLASTMVRFVTAIVLVVPLALSGWFDRTVLVLFVAVSYLMMLLVDTLLAVRIIRRAEEQKG
jgi:hypothetical protein